MATLGSETSTKPQLPQKRRGVARGLAFYVSSQDAFWPKAMTAIGPGIVVGLVVDVVMSRTRSSSGD